MKDTEIPICPVHGVNQSSQCLCQIPVVLTLALFCLNGLLT